VEQKAQIGCLISFDVAEPAWLLARSMLSNQNRCDIRAPVQKRDEETPERTAFVRFGRELTACGLDRSLFEAIACDLEAKGATIRKGTIIDATIIGSATKGDEEAA
jgi:hypothetical protein